VSFIFVSVAAASEDRLTAVINAVVRESVDGKAKHKENIARPKRGKRTTGKRKTAVDMG